MSGAQEHAVFPPALEVDRIASEWLERRSFGPWTENDQRKFDSWFTDSLAHRIAFVRLEAGWKRTERMTVLQSPMRATVSPQSHPWTRGLKFAAAALALVAIGGGFAVYSAKPDVATYATKLGEREVLSLADGSQIELNTETSLRTAVTAGRRIVWLDKGEAYFRVKHDAAHPFVVVTGNRRLTDIGTAFTVRQDAGNFRVAVLEGSVRLDGSRTSPGSASPTILKSGDTVVATVAGYSISRETREKLTDELGWRRGVLIFNQTPLSQAAIEINRYNSKKLVIADPVAARMKIGGTFPKNNVDAITAAARELFGLHVEDRGTEIIVTR